MLATENPHRDGERNTGRADRGHEAHLSNGHRLEEGGKADRYAKTCACGRCDSPNRRYRICSERHPAGSEHHPDDLGAENEPQRADAPRCRAAEEIPEPVTK
jgi:hypothetical protein